MQNLLNKGKRLSRGILWNGGLLGTTILNVWIHVRINVAMGQRPLADSSILKHINKNSAQQGLAFEAMPIARLFSHPAWLVANEPTDDAGSTLGEPLSTPSLREAAGSGAFWEELR